MAMAVDNRLHQPSYHTMDYDAMRYAQPQFTDPWGSRVATTQSQMYAPSLPTAPMTDYKPQLPNISAGYSAPQMPATSMATGIIPMDSNLLGQSGLQFPQGGMSAAGSYGSSYASAAPTSAPMYPPMAAVSAPQYSADILQRTGPYGCDRRTSHPSVATDVNVANQLDAQTLQQSSLIDFSNRLQTASAAERQGFSDALDASRGMVAMSMSQTDITPRNIYGTQPPSRTSSDSYGFPSSHSSHSSISSGSGYQNHYSSSVSEYSVGEYSSASEVEMGGSRTLPRPSGLIGGTLPPAPQSMMGQFSSKVSSSSQKKHKCKICDKRFTRPSSLQTHMYSHTGEKPFSCNVDGCGRHFSVVSNLRRHRKVHKGEGHDHPSPDDDE
ncbi:hypothetical protein B0A48_14311 [Cryoendolithus antarcticus]|uniref:C2H2-type domain-containing protein n=1 Tax=Cryoendolithus antarcticus TaxID=1507870 RepID=A0A1V8SJJ2_9PEZI|nr:hypothetical protein B0A48_14311 [Cryoendolithus antarcticus]